jgi:hypothetical protein
MKKLEINKFEEVLSLYIGDETTFTNLFVKNLLRGLGYWATQKNVSFLTDSTVERGIVNLVDDNGTYCTYKLVPVATPVEVPVATPVEVPVATRTELVSSIRNYVKSHTGYAKTYIREQGDNNKYNGSGYRYEFFDVAIEKEKLNSLLISLMEFYPEVTLLGVRKNAKLQRTLYVVIND